jgi:hypothetical protein
MSKINIDQKSKSIRTYAGRTIALEKQNVIASSNDLRENKLSINYQYTCIIILLLFFILPKFIYILDINKIWQSYNTGTTVISAFVT